MIWIIDASVAIRWFIDEEVHAHADEVLVKGIMPILQGGILRSAYDRDSCPQGRQILLH